MVQTTKGICQYHVVQTFYNIQGIPSFVTGFFINQFQLAIERLEKDRKHFALCGAIASLAKY
jgi:hypothetical protein